jgi:hypothetical protein
MATKKLFYRPDQSDPTDQIVKERRRLPGGFSENYTQG